LFALLDESKARVRMLVAPAGYGKTTLAEQWVARDGRQGAWFTARSSATDVAALALGLARSSTSVVADCDVRLREHMRALPAPAENVDTLAEILGEDLAEWPPNAWLVIDDYHEVAQEPRAEDFVAALVSVSPIQFLVASRVRPSWISTKELMYGDVLELSQAALAMDNTEAADVLVDRTARSASGLVSLAHGWPAVIGLASVSSAEIEEKTDQLPASFYRFFADEVFSALSGDVQQGLTTLAVAPLLDRELAVELLGSDAAESVCAAALDVGLLVERDARLDLHPLARVFLEERTAQLGLIPAADAARTCLNSYRDRREWDAAFDLIADSDAASELEGLMHHALDDLLDAARLATAQRWCDAAASAAIDAPIFALARAETMLRQGRHVEAVAHAESAALGDSQFEFRALALAGRAAHLASREEYALALYERAEKAATSERELRDARWGQLGCMIDLELPSSEAALLELSEGVNFGDPREVVRAAAQGLYFQLRQGALDLDDADIASQVLATVVDPLVRSSFLSGYGIALALTARYEEALAAADALQLTAEQFRLDFALPYALCAAAMAHTGSRRWRDAEHAASNALSLSRASRDVHAELLSCSVLLRLYAQQGRFASGLELDVGRMRRALKASIGEVACSRALVLACAGRTEDALELVDEVRGTSTAVELIVLAPAVDAVCALRSGSSDIVERVTHLESIAFQTGAVDLLVTTYRACPELLSILLRAPEGRRFRDLVERIEDEDLASAVGYPIAVNDDKRLLLSPRETDVFELLRTGLTNRQIGKLLFIEESTVKAHTHRIYDKLGVRSRSALAVQAALERSNHATSATDSMSSETGSS
jgi:DNA-binding CsgD family transcriptional regulator